MSTPARVAKHWKYDPKFDVEEFNLDTLNESNLINQLLKMKQSDFTYSFIMNCFGSFNGKSLCHHYDTFDVPVGAFKFTNEKGKEVSNAQSFVTTIGIWTLNIYLFRDFGLSFLFDGYINENIDKDIYGDIVQKLTFALMEDKITTEKMKQFLNYTQFLMPLETILSPVHTEKILQCTKEINKLKDKLFKEHKEELDKGNINVAEDIEIQLLKFAEEYLKDDPSLDVYMSGGGGNWKNNFKNMYVMKGAMRDPDPNTKQPFTIAKSSFLDGISSNEYTALANSLTGGPYSRNKKTQAGGYWEKIVEAATNTIMIDEENSDCGTNQYLEVELTKKNLPMFMYSYIVKPDKSLEELTSLNADKYLGKTIKIRSTLFCKNKNSVCHRCAGNFFYRRGSNRIGLACAQLPTVLKLIAMKAFHDSTIPTVNIMDENINEVFGL